MRFRIRRLFVILALVVSFIGPVLAFGREPVNGCIMLPEVMNGRSVGEASQSPVYEPESCIAMDPRILSEPTDSA